MPIENKTANRIWRMTTSRQQDLADEDAQQDAEQDFADEGAQQDSEQDVADDEDFAADDGYDAC
jgi:hypothetical protein